MAWLFTRARKSQTTCVFGALVPIQLWFFDQHLEGKRERIRALAREVNQISGIADDWVSFIHLCVINYGELLIISPRI